MLVVMVLANLDNRILAFIQANKLAPKYLFILIFKALNTDEFLIESLWFLLIETKRKPLIEQTQ